MREEIFKLAQKNEELKCRKFIGFKTDKNFGIKYNFYKNQKILICVLSLIIILLIFALIKFKSPVVFPIIITCVLIYIIFTLIDSIIEIKVNVKENKIIIKKILKKYVIDFKDIENIYLVASPNLKGIKSKIRILYNNSNKAKNLSLETFLLKTKDIKHFISQINCSENIESKEKQANIDDTIISSLDLTTIVVLGIIILIDFLL